MFISLVMIAHVFLFSCAVLYLICAWGFFLPLQWCSVVVIFGCFWVFFCVCFPPCHWIIFKSLPWVCVLFLNLTSTFHITTIVALYSFVFCCVIVSTPACSCLRLIPIYCLVFLDLPHALDFIWNFVWPLLFWISNNHNEGVGCILYSTHSTRVPACVQRKSTYLYIF